MTKSKGEYSRLRVGKPGLLGAVQNKAEVHTTRAVSHSARPGILG